MQGMRAPGCRGGTLGCCDKCPAGENGPAREQNDQQAGHGAENPRGTACQSDPAKVLQHAARSPGPFFFTLMTQFDEAPFSWKVSDI